MTYRSVSSTTVIGLSIIFPNPFAYGACLAIPYSRYNHAMIADFFLLNREYICVCLLYSMWIDPNIGIVLYAINWEKQLLKAVNDNDLTLHMIISAS